MSLLAAGGIIVLVTAIAVGVMLFVRRTAPEGSYFEDGDRAAGVFGVLSTGFAVLLGFVVFLAFESYDTSRSGAEAEAQVVQQQFQTAQFMPVTARARLSGELVCYARTVVHGEWPKMQSGTLANTFNPWSVALFRTIGGVEPTKSSEQTAFDKWFDQSAARQEARNDRVHGAEGVVPTPLWIVLLLSATIIFVFMLFFADSAERVIVQATMMGGVMIVISSMLLLLVFLDSPYRPGVGGLQPTAMERTLLLLDQGAQEIGIQPEQLCDERGVAT